MFYIHLKVYFVAEPYYIPTELNLHFLHHTQVSHKINQGRKSNLRRKSKEVKKHLASNSKKNFTTVTKNV